MCSDFPGLAQVLSGFVSSKTGELDVAGVYLVLQQYLSLAATVADMWAHVWIDHGIMRGQSLDDSDNHIARATDSIDMQFEENIRNWQSNMPRYVRCRIAEHDFSADFLFLANYVFPTFIAPRNSTIREDMFKLQMHRYIIEAATTASVDQHGHVAGLIEDCGLSVDMPNRTYISPLTVHTIVNFRTNPVDLDFQDVQFEFVGPLIVMYSHTEPVSPCDDSICTICQDKLMTDGPTTCVRLSSCEHMFHSDCLDIFVNDIHTADEVRCPNCRAKICIARPRQQLHG